MPWIIISKEARDALADVIQPARLVGDIPHDEGTFEIEVEDDVLAGLDLLARGAEDYSRAIIALARFKAAS